MPSTQDLEDARSELRYCEQAIDNITDQIEQLDREKMELIDRAIAAESFLAEHMNPEKFNEERGYYPEERK